MTGIATLALSKLDTLLLQAALLEGEPARAAFGALMKDFDLDAVDYGRQRLLPLLHRNLTALGIDDPRLGRLRGIRHYHWAKNQMRIKAAAPVLAALREGGVPTVLLKGAALIAMGLGDMSLRPMDDIDILVPPEQRNAAIEILAAEGFHTRHTERWYVSGGGDLETPGWPFGNRAGQDIDLHWYLLHLDCRPGADENAWARVRPAVLAGEATAVLSAADQILHAVAHAARWNLDSILRWATDVALILRREGPAMKWEPLVEEARLRRLAPPLHDGLAALRAAVGIAIPETVLGALKRLAGPASRFEHRLRALPLDKRTRIAREWLDVFDARRKSSETMRRPLPATFAAYLRRRFPNTEAGPAALLLYAMLGAPRPLRRALGIGRWSRTLTPESLPPLDRGFDPKAAAAGRDACLGGWSNPESEGRWTVAREAHMAWRVPEDLRGEIGCEIEANPFWPPGRPEPRVDFWFNETHAGRLPPRAPAGGAQILRIRVPAAAITGRQTLVLTVAAARIAAPAEFGLSVDARALGVFVRRVSFRSTGASAD